MPITKPQFFLRVYFRSHLELHQVKATAAQLGLPASSYIRDLVMNDLTYRARVMPLQNQAPQSPGMGYAINQPQPTDAELQRFLDSANDPPEVDEAKEAFDEVINMLTGKAKLPEEEKY